MRPVKETKQFKSPYPSLIKPYRCGRTVLRVKLAYLHETRRTAYLTVVSYLISTSIVTYLSKKLVTVPIIDQ